MSYRCSLIKVTLGGQKWFCGRNKGRREGGRGEGRDVCGLRAEKARDKVVRTCKVFKLRNSQREDLLSASPS